MISAKRPTRATISRSTDPIRRLQRSLEELALVVMVAVFCATHIGRSSKDMAERGPRAPVVHLPRYDHRACTGSKVRPLPGRPAAIPLGPQVKA